MSICFHLLPLSMLVLPTHLAPSDCGHSGVSMRQARLVIGHLDDKENLLGLETERTSNGNTITRWSDGGPSLHNDRSFFTVHQRNQGRIINGRPSPKGAWPWQVSLQVLHPKYGLISNWCGGVLIEPSWVLTAAHCINNDIFNLPLPALWTAVIGEWNKKDDPAASIRLPVERIFLHKHFNNYNNDIALLRLSEVPASKVEKVTIKPICLEGGSDDPGRVCVATGWGRAAKPSNRGIGPSMVLRQISLPIHNMTLCQEKYGPALQLNSGHLCAGRLDGSTGACVGDSGGPLQCSVKAGKWYLAGITSFGSGCARPGFPDVYTRVSHFLQWINETITSTDQLLEEENNSSA